MSNSRSLIGDANKIRLLRQSLGWTQELAATRSGYSARVIRKIESGVGVRPATLLDVLQCYHEARENEQWEASDFLLDEVVGVCHDSPESTGNQRLAMPRNGDRNVTKVEDGLRSTGTISSYLSEWIVPPEEAYCKTRQAIKLAARQMLDAYVCEYKKRDTSDLKWHEFDDTYRAIIDHSDSIVDSYVRVWEACDSSFLFATQKGNRTGLSAIWPLSDSAYEEMRAGNLSFADVKGSHIVPGSQNLFINSARELNAPKKISLGKITSSVAHITLYQIALLSRNSWDDKFRVLSIGGSPSNVERIESNGFVPLKNRMAKIPFPMFELSSTIDHSSELATSLKAKGETPKRFSVSCAPGRIKRMSLRGIVAAYQRILGKKG